MKEELRGEVLKKHFGGVFRRALFGEDRTGEWQDRDLTGIYWMEQAKNAARSDVFYQRW